MKAHRHFARGAILACLAIALPLLARAGGELKRRAYVGMGYRAVTAADSALLGPDASATRGTAAADTAPAPALPRGLVVNRVVSGGPAEQAGLEVGDLMLALDDLPVVDESGLRAILRERYAGDTLALSLRRGGRPVTLRIVASSLPEEQADSLAIEYTSFSARGARLRAVMVSPPGGAGRRLPAVLIVSALGSPQLIGVPFPSTARSLAYRLARAGFRVLRFELRGFGDSEGEDYHTTGFHAEVEDNLAALEWLAARPDVDPARVFIFGHSTGGMEAALLAGRRPPAGLVVSCTVGRTFYERMAETVRLQNELEGRPDPETDRRVGEYLALAGAIARGAPAAELRRDSTFAGFFNDRGRIMDDRTVEFWREQLTLNLAEIYGRIRCPVLIVWGASDFLTQRACHERIRDVLTRAGNADVTLRVIPGCDHRYCRARDARESFENYRTGAFTENPEAGGAVLEWLQRH